MDTNNSSGHRLIENELLMRQANEEAKQSIEEHTPDEEQPGLAISFFCECSALECEGRIGLTLKQYALLHQRNDRFVITAGHLSPSVEKVVDTQPGFLIVEKYALPA